METPEDRILNSLDQLKAEEFDRFKWFLQKPEPVEGLQPLPRSLLENADKMKTVDVIIQNYPSNSNLVMVHFLSKINRKDLAKRFETTPKETGSELEKINQILTERDKRLEEKDQQLAESNRLLTERDKRLEEKDQQLAESNRLLTEKDKRLEEKDQQLAESNRLLTEREKQLEEKDQLLKKREIELENINLRLVERDTGLTEKDGQQLTECNNLQAEKDQLTCTTYQEKRLEDFSPFENYTVGIIDWKQYFEQQGQFHDWEVISSMVLRDHKSGEEYSIKDALKDGRLTQHDLESYKDGKMKLAEFALLVKEGR